MKFSIIMPVYNVEDYLERSIESVINQSYKNFELILVNDGSTDSSREICEQVAIKHDNITVLHQMNSGSGIARQKGIGIALGEYICFVDPDDYLGEGSLANNAILLDRYSPDLLVNGFYKIEKNFFNQPKITEMVPQLAGLFDKEQFNKKFTQYQNIGLNSLWNKVYKKEFLDKNEIQFTNQRVGQDALFNYEVYKSLNTIFVDKKSYYHYDTLREGSAVKKFNINRVDFERNISNSYISLLDSFNLSNRDIDQYKYLSQWQVILIQLKNINSKDSPYDIVNKKSIIKTLRESDDHSDLFEFLDIQYIGSPFSRILFEVIKRNMYNTANILMKFYLQMKYNF